jgi:putative inorganic carbon (HCO3(-)) transporter
MAKGRGCARLFSRCRTLADRQPLIADGAVALLMKILSNCVAELYVDCPQPPETVASVPPTNAAMAVNTLPRQSRVLERAQVTHLYRDPFRLGLWVLIVITLTKFGSYFGVLRTMRPALLLFGFCVVYALLHPRKLILNNFRKTVTVRLLVAIAIVAICSAAFGISLGRSALFFIDNFSKTLAITFLMIATVRNLDDFRKLAWAFTFAGILLAYLSIFVVGISKVANGVSYDANDVGVFMTMTLPLAIVFVQCAHTKFERATALIGVGLIVATLVKTQSRGAFIGALAVFALLVLVPGVSAGRRMLLAAVVAVTMVLTAPAGYWTSVKSILADPKSDYNWDALDGRRQIARRGLQYMRMYPVFGVGINNFSRAEGTISDKARNRLPGQGIRLAAPHNSFVQAGAETGVVGLLIWISLVITNVTIPVRLLRRMPKTWRKGTPDQRFLYFVATYIPVAQVGFAVPSFFVSFAWLEPLYFLSALVVGLDIIARRGLPPEPGALRGPEFRSRRTHTPPNPSLPLTARTDLTA